MPKVVESLNKTLGKLLDVVVELWRWEADSTPAVCEPQSLVDVELDKADVVLVIFWNRFGTPSAQNNFSPKQRPATWEGPAVGTPRSAARFARTVLTPIRPSFP